MFKLLGLSACILIVLPAIAYSEPEAEFSEFGRVPSSGYGTRLQSPTQIGKGERTMFDAPVERISIRYVKRTGGAAEQNELPMRLLVIGDYAFRERDPDDILADKERIQIHYRNFDEVMRKQNIRQKHKLFLTPS